MTLWGISSSYYKDLVNLRIITESGYTSEICRFIGVRTMGSNGMIYVTCPGDVEIPSEKELNGMSMYTLELPDMPSYIKWGNYRNFHKVIWWNNLTEGSSYLPYSRVVPIIHYDKVINHNKTSYDNFTRFLNDAWSQTSVIRPVTSELANIISPYLHTLFGTIGDFKVMSARRKGLYQDSRIEWDYSRVVQDNLNRFTENVFRNLAKLCKYYVTYERAVLTSYEEKLEALFPFEEFEKLLHRK